MMTSSIHPALALESLEALEGVHGGVQVDGEECDGGGQQQQHQGHQRQAACGAVLWPLPIHTPGPLEDAQIEQLFHFSFDADIIHLQFLQLLNIFEHSRVQKGQGVVKTLGKVQAVSTLSHTAVPEIGASGIQYN